MKKFIYGLSLLASMSALTSCNDWLKEESPGKTTLDDFFTVGEVAVQTVNAAYAPLAWEYNHTYYPEWMIGDIASDDALKGGQNVADGKDAYEIDNFKVAPLQHSTSVECFLYISDYQRFTYARR